MLMPVAKIHRTAAAGCLLLATVCTTKAEEPIALQAMVITAGRAPVTGTRSAVTTHVLSGEEIDRSPALSTDSLLRSIPAFSLFRRSDSLTAHPTAQGVSLRGVGPSGASRSLVLLDGIPLNDPFGGWVAWTKIPRAALARVEVVPGGGAAAWGNAALGGVMQAFLRPLAPSPGHADGWSGRSRASVLYGAYGTSAVSFAAAAMGHKAAVEFSGEAFTTNGFPVVAEEDRGPVDLPAWNRHESLVLRAVHRAGDRTTVGVTLRGFEETRGNGTQLQGNQTRERLVGLRADGELTEGLSWNAVAYVQSQMFASTFTAIDANRTVETPASEQFAVPASAAGFALQGTWRHAETRRTTAGIDARAVRGETRENFLFSGGAFQQQRFAGGEQAIGGVFVLHDERLNDDWVAQLGARIDHWRDAAGRRAEFGGAEGPRISRFPRRDGVEFSPSVGAVWNPHPGFRLRGAVQCSFRQPTLNELYRPFRQGATTTLANESLRLEQATSGEVGAEWAFLRRNNVEAVPLRWLTIGATWFRNDLSNGVTNVTLPATGGTQRKRLNVDRSRIQGAELSLRWRPSPAFTASVDYLQIDAQVRRSRVAPELVGKRLAQVPRHTLAVGASWIAPGQMVISGRLRWLGQQFEDDENALRLGAAVVFDVGVSRTLGAGFEVFIQAENLGDARVETGRTATGVVNIGTPRFVTAGFRWSPEPRQVR